MAEPTLTEFEQELITLLVEIEWSADGEDSEGDYYPTCPRCDGGDPNHPITPSEDAGHFDDCDLDAALVKAGVGEARRG